MIRNLVDLKHYNDGVYDLCRTAAVALFDALSRMDNNKFKEFKRYIIDYKLTILCELLQPQYQHVIHLSMFKTPTLIFISENSYIEHAFSVLASFPISTFLTYKSFGLKIPSYEIIALTHYHDKKNEIRYELDSEGKVLYFLNEINEVIGMEKVKTNYYVWFRGIRQMILYEFSHKRLPPNHSLDYVKNEVIQRAYARLHKMTKINSNDTGWVYSDANSLKEIKELTKNFLIWIYEELQSHRILYKNLRAIYPILINRFMSK
uniref:Uncharacterized protein n=1 Tax=Faxonius propinquus nudivirus TaxID=3139431 RepID=A0AAU8GC74_9VIRU